MFYVIPLLRGIHSNGYLQHYILFLEALWLLLQSSAELKDIMKAEKLLQHFTYFVLNLQHTMVLYVATVAIYNNTYVTGPTKMDQVGT